MAEDAVAIVMVTYESAGSVGATLAALNPQLREDDELVVVDNCSRDGTAATIRGAAPHARVLEQEANLGFAAGCNVGVAAARAPLVLLLNPDARPRPGCLEALRRVAAERPDWAAWQALVTMNDGQLINTAGNVIHYLGMGWAGRCGESVATAPQNPVEVAFGSGAALVVRRSDWERLGGFDERYFMYGEDLDLGLRLWLAGRSVGLAPAAQVEHDYEFAKGGRKWFLLERNRWLTVVATFPTPLLALVLAPLLACELAVLVVAARDGWLRDKLRAQAAVLRQLGEISRRRRQVQATRQVSAGAFALRLTASLDSPYLAGLAAVPILPAVQRGYWALVLRLLGFRPEANP
jgi:N-acetylglucosaminyl-diphospho-decaprenol L-rhamnosyltransferase